MGETPMELATRMSASPALPDGEEYAPGVILLTTSMQVVYSNGEARAFSSRVAPSSNGKPINGTLPPALSATCQEILAQMRRQTDRTALERVVVRRVLGQDSTPVQVLGFGIPDQEGLAHSHILLLLDECHRPAVSSTEQIKERFSLTDREEQTLRYLLKGWTNKEIANELRISEHTVKAHVKHIMQKTRVTTRSAVIAQVHAT